jgi:hypothetical protein
MLNVPAFPSLVIPSRHRLLEAAIAGVIARGLQAREVTLFYRRSNLEPVEYSSLVSIDRDGTVVQDGMPFTDLEAEEVLHHVCAMGLSGDARWKEGHE